MDWNNLTTSRADTAGGKYSTTREITAEQLRKHPHWSAFRGLVYDVSAYAPYHPGGVEELFRGGGADGTMLFDEFHPWINVAAMLRKCQVGVLVKPVEWQCVELESCEAMDGEESGYYLVTFRGAEEYISSSQRLLPILSHCRLVTTTRANRNIERVYTQLSSPFIATDGKLAVVVKKSKRAKSMTVDLCTSPVGTKYNMILEPSLFGENAEDWFHQSEEIGMVVCGTGITPALQVITHMLMKDSSKKRLYLVWCHRDEHDWCLKAELEFAVSKLQDRLKITHLLSREDNPKLENAVNGRFDSEFIESNPGALPKPSEGKDGVRSTILICGTWEFERSARATMFLARFASQDLVRIPG